MNRRDFVQATAAVAAVAATGVRAATARRRPNLLYVFSDQHRAASLPGEPFNQAAAPNLDAFRHANFSMDRCVSNYPLCTPYRGILMSGRWPYQTGLTRNNVALPSNEISLGRVFRDAGYHTGYVGKWHLQGRGNAFIPAGPDRQGFEDWHVWARTNAHYRSWTYDPDTGARIQPDGWNCTTMTDQAITLIEQQHGATKPWMLMVSWNPPHPPYNPPAQDAERYPPDQLKLRPNVSFPLQGKSAAGEARPLTGAEPLRAAMQGYYGAITGVDAEFGRLLAALGGQWSGGRHDRRLHLRPRRYDGVAGPYGEAGAVRGVLPGPVLHPLSRRDAKRRYVRHAVCCHRYLPDAMCAGWPASPASLCRTGHVGRHARWQRRGIASCVPDEPVAACRRGNGGKR